MADQVMTGALGLIKRNGTVIGKMRNIRWSEPTRRQDVQGIGSLLIQETPAVQHTGTLTCDAYAIDFSKSVIPGAIRRDVQTTAEFEDNVVLDNEGVQIDVFKKVADVKDPDTGKIRSKLQPFAVFRRVFIEVDGSEITEGAISGHNQSFRYLDPVIYPS